MTIDGFAILLDDTWFLTMELLDILLIASTIYAGIYGALLCARTIRPRPAIRNGHLLPLLVSALLAIPAVFTPVGQLVATGWQNLLARIVPQSLEILMPDLLVFVWLAGSFMCAIFLFNDCIRIRRLATSFPPDDSDPAFGDACAAVRPAGIVIVRDVPFVKAVASCGLFGRHIFRPPGFMETYSREERYRIYVHELTHLVRRDSWTVLAAMLARSLFWFHPVVRLSIRNMFNDMEVACDHATLARKEIPPLDYARLILKAHDHDNALFQGFSGGRDGVVNRIAHITGNRELLRLPVRSLLITGLLLAALLLPTLLTPSLPIEAMPRDDSFAIAPDGTNVRIVATNTWQGAIATYTTVTITKEAPQVEATE